MRMAQTISPYRTHIKDFRGAVGLSGLGYFANTTAAQPPSLLLCPEWFGQPQPDWPKTVKIVGFPLEPMLPSMRERGEAAPIIITPGTGVRDQSLLLSRAETLAQAFARPVIALSPSICSNAKMPPGVRSLRFADLSSLLPGALVVVHHGGIGTTAEAIRAGVPQLVIPNRFDQPDNGVRIAELGLGAVILHQRTPRRVLVKTLEAVLSSRYIQEQVCTAAKLVDRQDGVQAAIDTILEIRHEHADDRGRARSSHADALEN